MCNAGDQILRLFPPSIQWGSKLTTSFLEGKRKTTDFVYTPILPRYNWSGIVVGGRCSNGRLLTYYNVCSVKTHRTTGSTSTTPTADTNASCLMTILSWMVIAITNIFSRHYFTLNDLSVKLNTLHLDGNDLIV